MRPKIPDGWEFLWEAEFEIERGQFGQAAALIKEAEGWDNFDEGEARRRYMARVLISVGRFSDAQQKALGTWKWDGRDIRRLQATTAMDLVTIGEVFLARGRYAEAIPILRKADSRAKSDKLEWVRMQDDIARANLGLGMPQKASEAAGLALSFAERQWGPLSIPYMDATDTLGLVRLAESNFQEAEQLLTTSRNFREALYGPQHPKVSASYVHAALLSIAQSHNAEAAQFIETALAIENFLAVGQPNGRWALALLSGADVFTRLGRIADAKDCYQGALPVLQRELGSDAPRLLEAGRQYENLVRQQAAR